MYALPVQCPFCNADNDKVIDSRASDAGKTIRRRRECVACSKRFTTYERVEQASRLMVVKRDGSRVPFSRENVLRGVKSACGKRPISEESKERVADGVEEELHKEFDREVASRVIGERVMSKLRDLDEVAYIRFASEYYEFSTVREIQREIDDLAERPPPAPGHPDLFGD